MPTKTRKPKDKVGEEGPARVASSSMTLQTLQQRFEKSGSLGDTNEERRRAWLYLLAIPYQPPAVFPAPVSLYEPANTSRASDLSASLSSVDGTPSLASDSKADSLDGISTPSGFDSMNGSLLQSYSSSGIPLDREGWQTGFQSALLHVDEQGWSTTKPSTEQWQVAESRRARRRRGTYDQKISTTDAEIGPDDSGIFGSVVDLGKERSDRPQIHDSITNRISSGDLSAASMVASKSVSSPSLQAASSSALAISPLAIDGEVPARSKANKRKKKKQKSQDLNREEFKAEASDSNASVEAPKAEDVDCPPYKLNAQFSNQLSAHPDERQVELDILRSFICPISAFGGALSQPSVRHFRRRQLQDLVVGVLRRYPSLHYYQGYHDVISTLLLTLSPHHPTALDSQSGAWASESDFQMLLEASERFSLFYLRDFMTLEITPCMGWLKVLRNLLRQVDLTFSKKIVEQTSALPFFALSWLITLLSHDLELGGKELNKVFDFILIGGPETILWITAALLVKHRDELMDGEGFEVEGRADPALLHHSLSKLPKKVSTDKSNIDSIIIKAKAIREELVDANNLRKGVMGFHSVMYTWSPLSADPALHSSSSAAEWDLSMARAEGYLSSPSSLQQIVLDPNPSPPAEEGSPFSFEKGSKGRRGKKKDDRAGTKTGAGGAGRATGAALLIGVVVVAGAALFLGSHTIDRHQKSKLAHDLSDLGRGLVGLVLCAAGSCQ